MSKDGLKETSLTRPAASDASDETEKRERSVVTDSCEGDRNMRHPTVSTGVCGGALVVAASSPDVMSYTVTPAAIHHTIDGRRRQ